MESELAPLWERLETHQPLKGGGFVSGVVFGRYGDGGDGGVLVMVILVEWW